MKTFLGTVALFGSLALALALVPAVAHPQEDRQAWAADAADPSPTRQGQWVRTDQYGWVWMPYADRYTSLPADGGAPSMYVYYPDVGWSWVVAPWIWGWGPQPFFGSLGCVRFGWWGHGFGRWDGFRGHYAGYVGRGVWNGGRWSGHRAASPGRAWGGQPSRSWNGQRGHAWGGGFAGSRNMQAAPPRYTPSFSARGGSGGHGGGFRAPAASHGGGGHSGGDHSGRRR